MTNTINLPQLERKMLREILYFLKPSDERQVWLVGGSIRDLLMGYTSLPDLDLATSFNPISAAREYARKTGAGFVVLDEERQVVRVVRTYNDEHYTFDISRFRAENIDEDLRARDFTINAIAARLFSTADKNHTDALRADADSCAEFSELELYDPLEGCQHLKMGLIIPCSGNLFTDDPLRLMRAFRFSALFNASFSPQLHSMIVDQAPLLSSVSGERIRDELFKVFQVNNSTHWIRIMHKTGILQVVFPKLAACEGVEQNEWHHLDVFEHSILTLENLEKSLIKQGRPDEWWPMFEKYLDENLSGNRTYRQLLKLGCLLHDLGKPDCKKIDQDSGKVIFHGHEMEGVRIARSICELLRLSANESSYLQLLVKNHMRPGVMLQQGISDKRLFRYFSETGRDGLGIALLSLADRCAAQGSLSPDELDEFELGIMSIMHAFYEQMKKPKLAPLLNGNDLITRFKLKPGPDFKRILEALEEAQFLGEITSREEALARVSELLQE